MVATAARLRQESRGAHSRVDFLGEREEWGQYNIVIKRNDDGSMNVEKVARGDNPEELAKIGFATLEELEGTNG